MSDSEEETDPAIIELKEKLAAKKKEIEESENPHLFTFDDGDTVDFSKPPDTSFANDLEPDSDGYKPITWTQLKKKFCYERPAHGFKLSGDISQKLQEHWERSKQIKIRDKDGVEGAVFFYVDDPGKYFSFDDVCVGNHISVKSPRYHRFMDKQEGMRLEDAKQVCPIVKAKFTDESRLDYGLLNKRHGNDRFKDGKFDDAIEFYDTAIRHMRGSFKERPEDEPKAKELVAQCYVNIAACHAANKNYQYVEAPCQAALRINASSELNAKAYYRMGTAALERKELTVAKVNLERAIQLVPGDPVVTAAIDRLNSLIHEQVTAEKEMFKPVSTSKFGLRKWRLSDVPDRLQGVPNFRDFTSVIGRNCLKSGLLRKNVLYRSSNFTAVDRADIITLTEDLGIKTIVDLRSQQEIKKATKEGKAKPEKQNAVNWFTPIKVVCAPNKTPKTSVPRGKSESEVRADRVTFQLDVASRAVFSLIPWYIYTVFILAILPFLWTLVARLVLKYSVNRATVLGTYKKILSCGAPELKEVFTLLADETNYPIVISCSVGKDRTGVVMMILQGLLGVPDRLIAADYSETTKHMTDEVLSLQRRIGLTEEWNVASEGIALDFLRFVREEYGSCSAYLLKIGIHEELQQGLHRCLVKEA